jgi:hypothetical protein
MVIYEHTVYFNIELNLVQWYSLISKFSVFSCCQKNMYLEVKIEKKNMYIIFMHIVYHYNYNEWSISLASL